MRIKTRREKMASLIAAVAAVTAVRAGNAQAAGATWDGGASNGNLNSAANWIGDIAPATDDTLLFDGFTRLVPLNTFPADTAFDGISFAESAGPFVLIGNRIALHDDITDNATAFPQTVAIPLLLDSTRNLRAAAGAVMTVSGVIAGAGTGFGVTKTGAGIVMLAGTNTFTGPVTVTQGTLNFSTDANLGATPASATAGTVVIDGGTLRATTSLTINPNRGIALGPLFTSGEGTIETPAGITVSYAGVVANNDFGGTGSLVKAGPGTLALSGKSTYTGTTAIRTGTLLLDFAQSSSPPVDMLASPALVLGGRPVSSGNTPGTATLSVVGKSAAANSQSFASTLVDVGNNSVVATSGSGGGSVELGLGIVSHVPGGVVSFTLPTTGALLAGNTPGAILGGYATVGTDWAYVNATGEITPLPAAGYLNISGSASIPDSPASNVKLTSLTADITATANPSGYTNLNTISYTDNAAANRNITIAAGKTLRLGTNGGIFHTANNTIPITFTGGTLTAGDSTNASGEIVLNANSSGQTTPVIVIGSTITNNGAGVVTLVKTGVGVAQLTGTSNTYTGGTYINQGRFQLGTSPGTGPIVVQPGGQALLASSTTYTHSFTISGTGTPAEPYGAIRTDNSTLLSGTITLAGDARIQSVATAAGSTKTSTITGKITGPFSLETGGAQGNAAATSILVLSNPANDYTGDTKVSVGSGNYTLRLGAADVIPSGPGKGNVVLNGGTGSLKATLDLSGRNETLNGLSSTGNASNNLVTNSSTTTSILTIGSADQSSSFTGTFQDATPGAITLSKIGRGTFTLNGPLAVTGMVVSTGQVTLASAAGTAKVGTLTIASSAKLDLTDNRTVLTNTQPSTLASMLFNGRSDGTWTGNGITSSIAAADPKKITAIAYAQASDLGLTTWGDITTVPPSALVTKLAYYGDLNLDGQVDADDFARLDRGLARGLTGWINGDVDYSGSITPADYLLVDRSFSLQTGPLSPTFLASRQAQFGDAYIATLLTSLPEPSSLATLLPLTPLLPRRRRHTP